MKAFNPEKELNKIQRGNKNKVILFIISLLVVGVIGYSFALYQVRYSKRIIYTKVADFSRDLNLAVYVDGEKQTEFPDKRDDIIYTNIDCNDNKVTASWNYDRWGLEIYSKLPNKCNVYFETRWKDKSGASYPELYQGLIPVTIEDDGIIKVADLKSEWYDYDKHNWANAVLINDKEKHNIYYDTNGVYKGGTTIPISDILQMYVWIPRYKYKLFNAINGETSNPQMIEIEFETNTVGRSVGNNNGQWYTHPAFLFGNTELNGFWVGKFESSDPNDPNGRKVYDINEVTILPDKTSTVSKKISTIFDTVRKIEQNNKYSLNANEIDTHMMKNMEWGAVAYFSQSKYGIYSSDGQSCMIADMTKENCEVWANNTAQGVAFDNVTNAYGGSYTGCVGDSVNAAVKWNDADDGSLAKCDSDKVWTKNGVKASTTGNVSGIYDMSGGTWEYVMAVMKTKDGKDIFYGNAGFTSENMPSKKYYDLYEYGYEYTDPHSNERGYLGDATRETLKTLNTIYGSWTGDSVLPLESVNKVTWLHRGGSYDDMASYGIFSFYRWHGGGRRNASFRVVLTAQDGVD